MKSRKSIGDPAKDMLVEFSEEPEYVVNRENVWNDDKFAACFDFPIG